MTKPAKTTMREFLETGRLGPLSPEQTLLEVANIQGPPDHWLTNFEDNYPSFWIYSPKQRRLSAPKLEIAFQEDPPHQVQRFQLTFVNGFTNRFRSYGCSVRVASGGFSGQMTPSRFLRKRYWNPDDTTVYFSTHDFELFMTCGAMTVLFIIWSDVTWDYDDKTRDQALRDFGEGGDFGKFDGLYQIYQIISKPAGANVHPGPYHDMKNCSGRQYLDSLGIDGCGN